MEVGDVHLGAAGDGLAVHHLANDVEELDVSLLVIAEVDSEVVGGRIRIDGRVVLLQLGNIPYAVNGWKVYCRYSNTDAGYVDTAMAQITVVRDPSQAFTAAQPAVRRAGFEGEWAEESSGLCRILFTWHDESSWYVGIIRRDTSGLRDCWNMTGKFYSDGVLVYDDGHHWTETYSNDNSYETSNETWNGTGSFYLENGRLHWYNAQTGEELILVPA